MIIPANKVHLKYKLQPMCIGRASLTKINANIGASPVSSGIEEEIEKLKWAERWQAPAEPINLFLSPPFADLERRPGELLQVVRQLQEKAPPGSVLVLQAEHAPLLQKHGLEPGASAP